MIEVLKNVRYVTNGVLLVFCFALNSPAFAESLLVNLNDNMAQFQFGKAIPSAENAEFQGGLLYNNLGNLLVEAGGVGKGGDPDSGVTVGGGIKAMLGRLNYNATNLPVACITLGMDAALSLSPDSSVVLVGEFRATPTILTFYDADHFHQIGARLEIGAPNARLFFGYHEINFHIRYAGSAALDKGSFVGFEAHFF